MVLEFRKERNVMKKTVSGLLCFIMLLTAIPAFASYPAEIIVDGEYLHWMNESQINENGRIFVPVNEVAEAFGTEAKNINENTVDLYCEGKFLLRLTVGTPFAYTNGEVLNFGVSPKSENGLMYVPLRAFAEALGAKVEWLEASKTVLIDKSDRKLDEIVNPKKNLTSREVSLLEGRYIVEMPLATETVNNWYSGHKYETDLVYEYGENRILVEVYDLFVKTSGDLKNDIQMLTEGKAVVYADVIEQNGCKYLRYGNNGRVAIATCDDGEIIAIRVSGDGDRIDDVCKMLFESLKATDKKFETGGEITAGGFAFTLPENYIAFYEIGPDYNVWRIYEIAVVGEACVSALVYGGWHPSYSGEKTTKSVSGKFLGKEITWYIDSNGDMDALLGQPHSDYCYHLSINGADTAVKRSEILKIFDSIKNAE